MPEKCVYCQIYQQSNNIFAYTKHSYIYLQSSKVYRTKKKIELDRVRRKLGTIWQTKKKKRTEAKEEEVKKDSKLEFTELNEIQQ